MENNSKEYSENKNQKNLKDKSIPDNTTTGSGYDEAQREKLDGTNSQNPANPSKEDNGSQELVDKYNINDKAYSDSSKEDFVKTTSNFHHADEKDDIQDQE